MTATQLLLAAAGVAAIVSIAAAIAACRRILRPRPPRAQGRINLRQVVIPTFPARQTPLDDRWEPPTRGDVDPRAVLRALRQGTGAHPAAKPTAWWPAHTVRATVDRTRVRPLSVDEYLRASGVDR